MDIKNISKIETIRKLEHSDLDELFKLTSDENVARYMRFDKHKTIDETKTLMDEYLQNIAFAVTVEEQFAGVFILKKEKDQNDYSISTFLHERFWNKGYAGRILSQIKIYSKEELSAKSLVAYVVDENEGSRKVLVKNDFYVSEILEFPDWQNKLYVYKFDLK